MRSRATLAVLVLAFLCAPPVEAGLPGNDAGSGADAPDTPSHAPVVRPHVVYDGVGAFRVDVDHYAFHGRQGDRVALAALPGGACAWRILEPDGSILSGSCNVQFDGTQLYEIALRTTGTHHFRLEYGTGPYRFGYGLNGPPPALTGLEPSIERGADRACGGGGAAPTATHGETPEGLVYAALKTGFRAVVAWETAEPTLASVRYNVSGGEERVARETFARRQHVFVLDALPQGETLCFQADGHAPRALRLANAMTAWDPAAGAYTLNLLVVANENPRGREILEKGMDVYAHRLRDATDGYVQAGRVILVYGDVERQNTGSYSCFYATAAGHGFTTDSPTCDRTVDAVFAHDSCAGAAACAPPDGIRDPRGFIMMNSALQASPVLTNLLRAEEEVGAVFTHELGHYVFGAMDLYPGAGEFGDCWDPATGISVMGGSRHATEFDDANHRCPNEANIDRYVPTWTFARARFPEMPNRATINPGPAGAGGAYKLHAFTVLPALSAPTTNDDAGSGRDAPSTLPGAVPVVVGPAYRGTLVPLVDASDVYVLRSSPGEVVIFSVVPSVLCPAILDAQAREISNGCGSTLIGMEARATVPADGSVYLRVGAGASPVYSFTLALEPNGTVVAD